MLDGQHVTKYGDILKYYIKNDPICLLSKVNLMTSIKRCRFDCVNS